MRKFLWTILPLVVLPAMAAAQFDGDPSTKPAAAEQPQMKPISGSAELKKLNSMVGSYRVSGKSMMTGKDEKMTGFSRCSWSVGGAWIHVEESATAGKMKMHGNLMMSYDAGSKAYMGYWFDNYAGQTTVFKGNFEGEKLVMSSEGGNGMPPMTVTYSPIKRGTHMEMTMGGQTVMSLDYTRVVARKAKPKAKAKKPAVAKVVPPVAPTKPGGN